MKQAAFIGGIAGLVIATGSFASAAPAGVWSVARTTDAFENSTTMEAYSDAAEGNTRLHLHCGRDHRFTVSMDANSGLSMYSGPVAGIFKIDNGAPIPVSMTVIGDGSYQTVLVNDARPLRLPLANAKHIGVRIRASDTNAQDFGFDFTDLGEGRADLDQNCPAKRPS